MKIGDRVYVHGHVDEIRKDIVIIRNDGGYFGTIPSEIVNGEFICCKDCKYWREDHTCGEHSLTSPMTANEFCSRAERRTDG